ncbi:DUF2793 domain-containing protein [Pontibaca salina]|uniref:DUF2793 domain-containing protein n=1 Tax=Pontibaca salina TaxID=2795731 RepID=A0A934HP88_9RHOB|nr:DUF2793 domain-containing protein [Pontibaca salina]MBI6630661.1 DUF2793 domain-containing protein [Pontibaca salina]
MPDSSPILALPYLQAAQAQKHVTHNEALQRLDLLVQMRVAGFAAETPPDLPQEGELHVLGASPGGVWAGQGGKIAAFLDDGWSFLDPLPGWRAWGIAEQELRLFDGNIWRAASGGHDNLPGVGVNTGADMVNRLAVSAPATLLSHEGAGHQLKVNKATAGDTAALLFQSDWSGHAEIGLAGEIDFSIKVSPDGTSWTEALRLDATSGLAGGAAVQAAAADITPGRLMRADYGYGPGNLLGAVAQSGGLPTGAVIEQGSNAGGSYTRWADGTQICWQVLDLGSITGRGNGTTTQPYHTADNNIWTFPALFSAPPVVSNQTRVDTAIIEDRFTVGTIGTPSNSQVPAVRAMRLSDSADAADALGYLTAVGRWF